MNEIEALAEAWASIDGNIEAFKHERDNNIAPTHFSYTGHFDGYMAEAEEMMRRLKVRGFKIVPA